MHCYPPWRCSCITRNLAIRFVLIDGDKFEPANLDRQIFGSLGSKADVKAAEIAQLIGPSDVALAAVPEYVTPENVDRLIRPGDFLFLCVDNHPTRKLISDHCQKLTEVVLLSGGNDAVAPPRQRGTYGNVQIAIRRDGRNVTVPITRYHPEIAKSKGKLPHEMSCTEIVPSTPQILFTNLAVASAMLNAFYAVVCDRLTYQEVKLDILDARMLPQFPIP